MRHAQCFATWLGWVALSTASCTSADDGPVVPDAQAQADFVTAAPDSGLTGDTSSQDANVDGDLGSAPDAPPLSDGGSLDTGTASDGAADLDSNAPAGDLTATDGAADLAEVAPGDVDAGPLPICAPGEYICQDNALMQCDATGTMYVLVQACDDTEICAVDACVSLCEVAADEASSEGCGFMAITTVNEYLAPGMLGDFAIIVGNSLDNPTATVQVSQGGVLQAQAEVAPGETHTFQLPMVSALTEADETVLMPMAAYEVDSTVPVAAYQYNPLHFEDIQSASFSFTNDASLLLPNHALGSEYMVMSWPTWGEFIAWTSGFVAMTAVEDGTEVTFTASSPTLPGSVAGLDGGQSTTVTLNRGDVLQFLGMTFNDPFFFINAETCSDPGWVFNGNMTCNAVPLDLTGSQITSSAPLAVFSGHDCLRIPYDVEACDHVEEMLLPTQAWGQEFVMTAPRRPDMDATAPTQYRVLALEADTAVEISPAVAGPFTLASGEVATFITDQDIQIVGDKRILAMQAFLGAAGLNPPAIGADDIPLSDPAAGTGVPQRQARGAYVFSTPDTYESNWLNIVRIGGGPIALDGVTVTSFTSIPSSPYQVARVPVAPGTHQISSNNGSPFTIMAYGYAPHTSYLFPGGLNLAP